MNKNMMLVIGAVVLVLVGGGLFFANQQSKSAEEAKMMQDKDAMMQKDDSAMEKTDDAMMKKDDTAMEKDDAMMQKSDSRYVEYSKATLDGAASNRRVLFFYASWCPTCKPTDADLSANSSKIPSDVTVIRVNYNDPETDQEEKDLAKKYGITYQHTFVQIDGQGKEVTKWNGGKTDELLAKIK
ncbi:MAG: thioredoxin family protein [Candidatus Levybacteria bacterium]|nr:thioredoxin family protein [Candidatus Levybacteria bacterium]